MITGEVLKTAQTQPGSDDRRGGGLPSLHDVQLNMAEVLGILWRRRGVILSTVALFLVCGAIALWSVTPQYTAEATLLLDKKEGPFANLAKVEAAALGDAIGLQEEDVLNEIQVIRSRRLPDRVIQKLGLDTDPEFNEVGLRAKALARIPDWVTEPLANVFDRRATEELPEERQRELHQAKVIDAFLNRLNVNVQGQTRVLAIRFTSQDPVKAARIANALADAYIADQMEARYEAARRATEWLTEKIAELRRNVAQSERAVENFRKQAGLLSAGVDGGTLISQQSSELNAQLILARTARAEAEARLTQVKRLVKTPVGAGAAADVLQSPVIQGLLADETEVKRKIAEFSEVYGQRHPMMASARAELRDIQAKVQAEVGKIVQALENEAAVARARENALQQSLEQTKASLAQSNVAGVQLRSLEGQAEAERTMLKAFLNRFEETSAQMDIANQRSDVRLLARAVGPEAPSFPRKPLLLFVIGTLGLLLAIGLVFLIEQFDRAFRSGEQIERFAGVRSLGLVPILKTSWRRRSDPAAYVLKRPTSQFAEAVRSVYTSILIANPDSAKTARSVLITSCQPREGKTTLSACIGRMYASSGSKAVIVEADVRRPRFHRLFQLPQKPGLVELLLGEVSLTDVLQKDEVSGVSVIPAGRSVTDPTRILASPSIRLLIDKLAKDFNLIIVDSPPLMAVADARVLAPQVDSTVLVVRWAKTNRNVVNLGLKKLFETGARVDGVVLSMVDPEKHAQYGFGDAAYYYRSVKRYYTT